MKYQRAFHILSLAGLLSVPVGPLFYFGFEVYLDIYGRLAQVMDARPAAIISAILGLFSGVGLELVGIISGHMAITFWGKKEWQYLVAAVASGAFYVVIGLIQLADAEAGLALGQTLFLIALPTYVLAGLVGLSEQQNEQAAAQNEQAAAQQAAGAEHQRMLEIIAAQAEAQAKLAQAEADGQAKVIAAQAKASAKAGTQVSAKASTQAAQMSAQSEQSEHPDGRHGKRRNELGLANWIEIKRLSSAQVAEVYGTSPSTARRWRAEADEEIRLLGSNGHKGGG